MHWHLLQNVASQCIFLVKVHKNTPLIRKLPPLFMKMSPVIIESEIKNQETHYEEGQVAENERNNCVHGEYL